MNSFREDALLKDGHEHGPHASLARPHVSLAHEHGARHVYAPQADKCEVRTSEVMNAITQIRDVTQAAGGIAGDLRWYAEARDLRQSGPSSKMQRLLGRLGGR